MTASEISVWVGIVSGSLGFVAGLVSGVWWIASKSKDIASHGESINEINRRCEQQRAEMLTEIEKKVCSVVRMAIKDMLLDCKDRDAKTATDIALLTQSMAQMQLDVEAIFERLNRRRDDHGQGERRR